MKQFKVPVRDEVHPDNQEIFDSLNKKLGFVPNIYAAYAYSSTALSRFMQFANGKTSLSNKEKEAINLVVSQINGCSYCLAAHTAIAKMNGFDDVQILELRKGYYSSDQRLDALVKVAYELAHHRGIVKPEVLHSFYQAGFNDENFVDLIVCVGEKTITNLLHKATNVPIDFPIAPSI